MKVIKNYLYNMGYQVLLILGPVITLPYISHVLGPHGYGIYTYTNTIMSYFILLANLGFDVYGARQIAYVQNDDTAKSQVFWEVGILKLITTAISVFALFCYFLITQKYFVLILAQSITLFAIAIDFSWYFTGIEDFKKSTIRNIFVQSFSLLLIFTLVKRSDQVLIYILIVSAAVFVGNMVLIPFLKNQIHRVPIKSIKLKQHIKPAILLFLPRVSQQVYLIGNKTVLGILSTMTAVGLFSYADSIIRLILTMVSAISAVLLPRISNLIAEEKTVKVECFMKESFELINFLSFPLIVGLSVTASKFIPIFLGNEYHTVSRLIIVESPAVLFITWGIAITNQYLVPSKRSKEIVISTVIGAVSNVILNISLIKLIGVYGASIATLIAEFLVTVYLFHSIKGRLHRRLVFFYQIKKFVVASLIMGAIVFVADKWLPNNIFAVGLEILIGIGSYLLCLFIFQTNILKNGKNFFSE